MNRRKLRDEAWATACRLMALYAKLFEQEEAEGYSISSNPLQDPKLQTILPYLR